jgi:hypothetical protein
MDSASAAARVVAPAGASPTESRDRPPCLVACQLWFRRDEPDGNQIGGLRPDRYLRMAEMRSFPTELVCQGVTPTELTPQALRDTLLIEPPFKTPCVSRIVES